MHKFVSFNLEISSAAQVFVSPVSSAALYGRGVFTTIAIYNSKPFLWEKHWRRLQENSARLNIGLSDFDEEKVKTAFAQIILQNNLETGRARLTLFDESPGRIWNFESPKTTSLLITTADVRETKKEFRLTVSPFSINSKSPLAIIKSCNYLENLIALEDAKTRGFDEAIRLNEGGEITSAATANIFWIKREKIFTPSLETGCLAGTTREFLIENFPVSEVKSKLDEITKADEIFLTSAGIGIVTANFNKNKKNLNKIAAKIVEFLDLNTVTT